MRRRRNSGFLETQTGNSDEQIQMSCLSITELPTTVFLEILLKLPTESIVMCKCVSKSWYSLISDPHFVGIHLARPKTCTLIRVEHRSYLSRSLYLLEPENVCSLETGTNLQVNAKLKMPLTKVQNFCYVLRTMQTYDQMYDIVNSCNGLLCLYKITSIGGVMSRTAEVVVCNPVLGEFVHIPVEFDGYSNYDSQFGLGFSPNQNRYKVIRILNRSRFNPRTGSSCSYVVAAVEINTIGTESWRSVDTLEFEQLSLCSPVYCDGALYWIFTDKYGNYEVALFDLDEERFEVNSLPPTPHYEGNFPMLGIRVLGGRVYAYTFNVSTHVIIWVMHDNGISKSWTELFTVDVSGLSEFPIHCSYELLCCLNNEEVLMFGGPWSEFIYYNQSEGLRSKQLNFEVQNSYFEAISFAPSFISLKDIVKQSDVEVLNVNSGCGNLKVVEETYPLMIQGGRGVMIKGTIEQLRFSREAWARVTKVFEIPEEQRFYNVFAKGRSLDPYMAPKKKLKAGLPPPRPSGSSPVPDPNRPKKRSRETKVSHAVTVVTPGTSNLGGSTIPTAIPRPDPPAEDADVDPLVVEAMEYLRSQVTDKRLERIGSADPETSVESSISRVVDVFLLQLHLLKEQGRAPPSKALKSEVERLRKENSGMVSLQEENRRKVVALEESLEVSQTEADSARLALAMESEQRIALGFEVLELRNEIEAGKLREEALSAAKTEAEGRASRAVDDYLSSALFEAYRESMVDDTVARLKETNPDLDASCLYDEEADDAEVDPRAEDLPQE